MKNLLLLFFIICSVNSFSQKITYTGIILVDSLPEELLPVGVSELGFIIANSNSQPVGFGYEISELNYKIISKFGKEYDNFAGAGLKAYYRNDTIFFWSHVKYKDIQTFNYYNWDSKKLTLLESYTYDPSQAAMRDGEAELRKKNIREASELYNLVKYMPVATEAKTAITLLGVAHYLAMDAFKAGSYKEAVEYMDGAFVYHLNKSLLESTDQFVYNKIVMTYFDQKQTDSLGPWIADYALFLHKADSLQRSIRVSSFIIMCYPRMSVAYLTKGDALFDLKKEEDAKPCYDKYVGLMTAKGNESEIPQRVHDRLK